MNFKLFYSVLSILIGGFLVATNSLDFNPVRFHCTNYILNSYLYLFISIAIVFTTLFSLDNSNIGITDLFNGNLRFLMSMLAIILIISLTIISPTYFFTKHLLWIFFIALMSIFIYPIYKNQPELFHHAAYTTLGLVIALSIIAFYKQDIISDSLSFYLMSGLFIVIFARFMETALSYFKVINKSRKFNKSLSYISILLFGAFIMYDTKQIVQNAQNCVNPDYINQSLDVFLDTLNIFTNIVNIKE